MSKAGAPRMGLARMKEAAEFLGVSLATVYRWAEAGQIESRKIAGTRRVPWSVLWGVQEGTVTIKGVVGGAK